MNWDYRVLSVDRVVDGDTVDVTLDLGFSITLSDRVRLFGINAPETRTRDMAEKILGNAAKDWLTQRLATDEEIILRSDIFNPRGSFKRILGTFIIDGVNINESMVKLDLAEPYRG